MSEQPSSQERYERLVAPFLERLLGEFPVGGYPEIAPEPPLQELAEGWTVEVAIDDDFAQIYRPDDRNKVVRFDFLSSTDSMTRLVDLR
jgi:hypothetical protein